MDVELRSARVTPPGRIIRRELEARGWTQKDLAEITRRPEQAISQIIQGRKQIAPETALQLAAAFGTSADLWLSLEANYRIYRALQVFGPSEIKRRSRLYTIAPVSELIKRGWIQSPDSLDDLEQQVCSFLGIAHLTEQPCLAVSFRQGQATTPETTAEIAWVKRVEHLARAQTVAAYAPERLRAALPDLLAFSNAPEGIKQTPDFLRGLGVHFVIVPHLPHTYLDGAAFTFEDQPVIALTLRYDRIDSFWFALLHELAHIVAEHPGLYLDNLDEQNGSRAETEANRMAQDWLIAPDAFAEFVAENKPYFSKDAVRAFAERQGRHPGIIVGRLHYENLIPYKNLRGWLVKVKPHLQAWIDVAEPSS